MMVTVFGRCLRPTLPMNGANLRCLGLSVGIAIAGCHRLTPAEQAVALAEQHASDVAYARGQYVRGCLYQATGPFGSASLEMVKYCNEEATKAVPA